MTHEASYPSKILLFSGKRKSGKDYITDKLYQMLNPSQAVLLRISGPLKTHWGRERGLDVDELLSSSKYKENYRKDMVAWSEEIRKKDHGYFCRAAVELYGANNKRFWIVGDVRRKTDVKWFKDNYGSIVSTVRIICDDDVRSSRGWKFTEGIDDAETECDLDDFNEWDLEIVNDGQDLSDIMNKLASEFRS